MHIMVKVPKSLSLQYTYYHVYVYRYTAITCGCQGMLVQHKSTKNPLRSLIILPTTHDIQWRHLIAADFRIFLYIYIQCSKLLDVRFGFAWKSGVLKFHGWSSCWFIFTIKWPLTAIPHVQTHPFDVEELHPWSYPCSILESNLELDLLPGPPSYQI